MPAGVILAAGASERMGGSPKALLPFKEGQTVVARLLRVCRSEGLTPLVVVVGAQPDLVSSEVPAGWAVVKRHEGWITGRTGSIKSGLIAAGNDHGGTLLWPVDHPFVREGSVAALIRAASGDSDHHWWVPEHAGRRGHPIILDDTARREVLTYGDSDPLHRYPRSHPELVSSVSVPDPGVTENTDTPTSFDAAKAHWRGESDA